jgi:predicted dehydrogenase
MNQRKRYALVGAGSRAGMFVNAITTTYTDVAELVAFCDQSQTRMNWYNEQLASTMGLIYIDDLFPLSSRMNNQADI